MRTTADLFTLPRFDPAARFVAGQDLLWGMPDGSTVEIKGGDDVDLQDLGLSEAEARRLYRTRHLAMVVEPDGPPARMLHRGFGRYDLLDEAGRVVAAGVSKDEAARAIEQAGDG